MVNLDYVQYFLEDNIDTVDAGDWQGMFMFWYQNQSSLLDCHPGELKELTYILTHTLGVQYETLYRSAEQALSEYLQNIVENEVAKLHVTHAQLPCTIYYSDIMKQLKSNLLHNSNELYALMETVTTKLGYDSSSIGFTVR